MSVICLRSQYSVLNIITMDRRKYLKTLAVGSITTGALLTACEPVQPKNESAQNPNAAGPDRQPAELERYRKLTSETFFTDHEMATITILVDIIIPKDEVSGSATDAKVPEFIEFIVKDMPHHKTPMRGGLRWLDLQCMNRFNNAFKNCSPQQQMELVDEIAWPEKAKPGMEQGVAFFNRLRDLTATGFYTSEIGIKDIGYVGNKPNQWDGVPQEVLDQYGVKYDERTLAESVKFES
jgi:gluconate 2-dehydrogenase gamma chain